MIRALLATALLVVTAVPARAELVFLTTGRALSAAGHRTEGDQLVVTLRSGGEITCALAILDRIEPDEMPPSAAPEPPAAVPAASTATVSTDVRFDALIQHASRRHGVDTDLVRAVIQVESAYQPRARSRKGAMGLMQLMPSTARQYGLRNAYDPASNIDAGTRHLKSLLDRYPLRVALAAYNSGEASVSRFGGIPPFQETVQYVARILALIGS